ncbi:hypothetical protein D3C76_1198290 [compost metagenome]
MSQGYVEGVDVEGNLRDKHIILTSKGQACNRNMMIIKKQLEQQITNKLGQSNVELIKTLLKEEWLES